VTFWIFDFGFWIKPENQPMNVFPSKCVSDNRKSAIQNLKLVGFLTIVALLVGWAGMAHAQDSKKIPRLGYLSAGAAQAEKSRLILFR
jgi:hypothetical protein